MNPRSRDILLIVVALAAVLGAGFGLGNLVANRNPVANPPPPSVEIDQLESETLEALRRSLDLDAEQQDRVRPAVRNAARKVLDTRQQALLEYHRHMLDLHDEITPGLDPAQRETLLRNRRLLEDTIEKRFETRLNVEDAPQPDTPVNPEEQR